VSNFQSVKRPIDCVEILATVKQNYEKVRLVMVGDGPELSAVTHHAKTRGVGGDVIFVGKKANIADYLGVSDIFLLPSELEAFGLAALEALACELPVVATRIGGIPEVVTDRETGFLSDVGDTAKMSADTLKLLEDEELRRSFGEKGRVQAIERYSTEKIIPQYIAFYERVLQKTGARTSLSAADAS